MAYTPGPWAIHHDGKPLFGYWHIRQDPKDWDGMGYQAICTLPSSKKGTHYGEMFHANALLITAAPDMLEALKFVLEHIADPERGPRDLYPAFGLNSTRAIAMVRAAIERAEGKSVSTAERTK